MHAVTDTMNCDDAGVQYQHNRDRYDVKRSRRRWCSMR
jgi:hypothetical protein